MIRSYSSRALARYAERGDASRLSIRNLNRLDLILAMLDAAVRPADLALPGFEFHPLKGKLAGRFAVSVSANWRVTFAWDGADAVEVDLEDYH